MSTVASVREVTNSHGFKRLARLGLATRAVIYLLIGWLAILIARGEPGKAADQRGALQEVVQHTGGTMLLWVIVAGLIGYSLWRFSEAAFGVTGEGRKKGPRVQSFARGCIYTFFAVSAVNLLVSSAEMSMASQEQIANDDGQDDGAPVGSLGCRHRRCGGDRRRRRTGVSVSYTHLTLPTICSV